METDFSSDPIAFIRELTVPTSAGPRRFGEVIADFQLEVFEALAPSFVGLATGAVPPIRRAWLERTKGASKDSDLACLLLWLLAFAEHGVRVQVGAYDAAQADEIRLIVRSILKMEGELNSVLSATIEVLADSIRNKATGASAEILTRDSRGSHGSRPHLVIINECSHIVDKEFAETLMDNADKMPRGVVIIATNAGFDPSWQLEWKRGALQSGRWYVHEYKQPAPWVSADDLAESERRNSRSRFLRLWHGEYASGGGDAIDGAAIDAAIVLEGEHAGPQPGFRYSIGVDLSLRRDSSAIVLLGHHVGHLKEQPPAERPPRSRLQYDGYELPEAAGESIWVPGDGAMHVAHVEVFTPTAGGEIDLTAVENSVALLHRVFNAVVLCDEYQAAMLAQRLRAVHSVPAQTVPPTGPVLREQAGIILDAFKAKPPTIKLYPQAEALLADIRRWRLVEKSYGLRLVSPQGVEGESTRHGDTASALALAALASQRFANHAASSTIEGELICWP